MGLETTDRDVNISALVDRLKRVDSAFLFRA